jgi:Xaa-Pro aminopeptidase
VKKAKVNPFAARLASFADGLAKKGLDAALVSGQANVNSLTGVDCDNACLLVAGGKVVLFTDFRYVPAIERLAPWLKVGDIRKLSGKSPFSMRGVRLGKVGFESSITHSKYLTLKKALPGARLVDVAGDLAELRSVKTASEIDALRAAAKLNDEIWSEASGAFRAGMTEKDMARAIKRLMIDRGDGEAFETIVCVGENAAECHHVPDGTKWDGKEPVLVDMGVRLGGYCSDMTRNVVPARPSRLYRKVYSLVLEANMRAIDAVKPGITAGELDAVARRFLAKNGFGKAFGHSLGHGVGIEIHEAPWAAKKQKTVLKPGMVVTIEPGVYLPGNLGVRIEDLVVVTDDGCEMLSSSAKDGGL